MAASRPPAFSRPERRYSHDVVFKKVKIRSYEVGLYFRDGEFKRLLTAGRHWLFDPLWKVRVDVVSQRDPWLVHDKLDVIVKSGALTDLRRGR